MPEESPDPEKSRVNVILAAGSDIAGPAAGAAAGLLIGGPGGAIAGAAVAAPATAGFRRVLGEIAGRLLGQREQARAGAVLLAAAAEVEAQLAAGRELRDDGLLGNNSEWSDADEIAEAAVLAAQRDPQEAKAPLIGKLLGRLQFEPRVSAAYAHLLIREAEALTYRQLCCLVLFNLKVRDRYSLPEKLGAFSDPLDPRIGLLQEIFELCGRTMLQQRASDHPGTDIVTFAPGLRPARLELVGLGGWLSDLMGLPEAIEAPQLETIAALLRGDS